MWIALNEFAEKPSIYLYLVYSEVFLCFLLESYFIRESLQVHKLDESSRRHSSQLSTLKFILLNYLSNSFH